MNHPWLFVIFGVASLYFGIRILRVFPTLLRLLGRLLSGAVKWPGPSVHDADPNVSSGRQRLGWPQEHLFSTFIWNIFVVLAGFVFSLLNFLSSASMLDASIRIDWVRELPILIIVYVGTILSLNRMDRNMTQVKILLSDMANDVEPRQVDGSSAEADYAIEHPLVSYYPSHSSFEKALKRYLEALRILHSGDRQKGNILYQEALSIDNDLHQRAYDTLSNMVESCSPTNEGPLFYWLGIHSESLRDFQNAAIWYEKAADAFAEIGHEKRQGRACCNLGTVLLNLGQGNSAMATFEKAVTLNSKDGIAHFNIGMLYYMSRDPEDPEYDKALEAFANAIAADPEAYGPVIAGRMRSHAYTWEEDLREVMRRVAQRRAFTN